MAPEAEVVLLLVDDYTPPDDAVLPREGDDLVGEVDVGDAAGVGDYVAQVADVADGGVGGAVVHLEGNWGMKVG